MKATASSSSRPPRILRVLLSRSSLRKLFLAFFLWTILEAHIIYYRIIRTERETKSKAVLHNRPRVFIASLHWNNEKILRSDWSKGVVELVNTLGPENVFVSVYESGSWDDSKGALRELDQELEKTGVQKKIVLDEETHAELVAKTPAREGWITAPDGKKKPRRIPYLSKLRNLSLQPLLDLAENGTTFDHVLFLGDVIFSISDILTLLTTNSGHYAAACSLDFSKPPSFYDTFALRDSSGHEHATQTWPYFRSSRSRKALLSHSPAVPVSSCWNGIVAMPASSFLGISGLKFRGVSDTLATYHLEGSECCLIHADNPASKAKGVFLNPHVRVGYNKEAYTTVHPEDGASWLSLWQIWFGIWKNRVARWTTTSWFKEQRVISRISGWRRSGLPGETREEKGGFCLINEMQVVVYNGWAHL
ncbi:cryptococcal mannosyltransferase 1-domain-containing protein [Podospora fimiseda]|uniref:Cryptococcal mannosyltransferase 1-domain-containing protein n=1 Tax=Podospora fimiseda TaxID=252190 RepID=A0AAN7BMZ1_9PEZI|nr:cryptococcal mannosyltransferase 1-domain-containing protein [Podospora fimiseda]